MVMRILLDGEREETDLVCVAIGMVLAVPVITADRITVDQKRSGTTTSCPSVALGREEELESPPSEMNQLRTYPSYDQIHQNDYLLISKY
jgi:hypothetical protein